MAKVLVTGGAGFIGSHVVDLYLENGFDVVIVDNLSTGRRANLNPAARFYEVDLRDPALADVFAAERPDYVNHHAGQIDVRRSVADPLFDAEINILGSLRLIHLAQQHEVQRFVYISTGGAVYGEPVYLPCDEEHPINPLAPYGASKHTVEHYLYLYRQNYDLEYTVLRYPNVYGPRQDPHGEAGVVSIFAAQMLAREPAYIYGDGEQARDFTYVGDCARANLLALTVPHESGIYNLGSGQATTINELFGVMRGLADYPHDAQYRPARLGETRRIYLTAAKAQRILGWQPQVSLVDGLQATLEHIQREITTP